MVATLAPPRIQLVPKAKKNLAADVFEIAEMVGLEPDPWQRLVIQGVTGIRADGKWASKEDGINVPRQNGKGGILELLELAAIFTWLPQLQAGRTGDRLLIHSAHEFITSQKHFDRVWSLVETTPELLARVVKGRPIRSHGHEGFRTVDGCQIEFRSRTKAAGRGFSCDFLVFDEGMFLPESAMGALWPTLRSRPNPKVIYAGSAVDQEINNEGIVFSRLRERALKAEPNLAYFEWSLDYDHPDDIPEEDFHAEESYRQSNPAYGIRIHKEHFASEVAALDRRTVAVELLGVGDYPDPTATHVTPISPEQWEACTDESSEIVSGLCLAFDVSPERRTSIAAAGRNPEGKWHVEVIEKLPGTGWLPARLHDLVQEHEPEIVCCDKIGPGASLIAKCAELDVDVRGIDGPEHAQACSDMVDAVAEDKLRHLGSVDLLNAIRAARTRNLGDRWAWSRRSSVVDISPLVAVTLALWAAMGQPEEDDEGPVIY